MFEAYSVAVTLRINNLVTPQLLALGRDLEKVEAHTLSLRNHLKALGADVPALRSISSVFSTSSAAIDRATRSAAALQMQLAAVRATAATMPAIAPHATPGPGPRVAPPGAVGGGGRSSWHGGNIHMGPGGVGIGGIGMHAGGSFVPIAVAAAGVWGTHSLYESAKALDTERARFRLLGMTPQQNAEATKFIREMRVFGTTQVENSKSFREAQGIFRESGLDGSHALDGAKLAAPILAKLNFATAALDEEAKNKMHSSNLAMLRWVEMSGGLKSPQKFGELADLGWKLTQTSGGNVNWEALRQFSAISGNAGRFITAEGLAALEPVIGELKGSGAGTGLRTALNRITGIVRIPNQVAHSLVENGIWDASKVEWNKSGGVKKFTSNPFTTYDDFVKSPVQWYANNIIPLYEKQRLSSEERGRSNSMLFGGTGGRLFTLIEQQMPTLMLSIAAAQKALGVNASVDEAKRTLSGKEREFVSAWGDFKTEFSESVLPTFSKVLTNGANFLRGINGFMESPTIKFFMDGMNSQQNLTGGLATKFLKAQDSNNLIGPAVTLWRTGNPQLQGDRTGPAVNGMDTGGGAFTGYRSPIRGGNTRPIQVETTTVLDGRAIAKTVSTHQAKELQRPQTGPRTADGRQSLRAFDTARGG